MNTKRRFELIVFDWDGTLLDSAGAIASCLQAACRDLGFEPPENHVARHVIGLGLQDALTAAVPQVPQSDYGRLAERYRYHFMGQDQDLNLFEGVFALVKRLYDSGVLLAIATGKTRRGLDRALAVSGLEPFFHVTRCADESSSKPHPAMLHEIMERVEVSAGRALMVGDTTHDLQMARNAGVAAVAVAFGAHPRTLLLGEQPLACVDTVPELEAWLKNNI